MPATQKKRSDKIKEVRATSKRTKAKPRSNSAASKTIRRKSTSAKNTGVAAPAVTPNNAPPEATEPNTDSDALQAIADTEASEVQMLGYGGVSEQATNILSIIEGLEGQVETAFKLKDALEIDLAATRERLSKELAARADMETRLNVFEAQSGALGQLREDMSFAEDERNKFAELLSKIQPKLQTATEERDLFSQEATTLKENCRELESDKTTLEAKILNLKDKIVNTKRLEKELTELTGARRDIEQQVREISARWKDSDASKNALVSELENNRESLHVLRQEAEDHRQKEIDAENRMSELQLQLEQQQIANTGLIESVGRLESETRMSSIEQESLHKELDAAKKALQEICSQATRTSGRVRQRYFNAND